MYAHYFAGRNSKQLVLSSTPELRNGAQLQTIEVKGKAEAKRLAKVHGAEPWNF